MHGTKNVVPDEVLECGMKNAVPGTRYEDRDARKREFLFQESSNAINYLIIYQ